MNILYVGSHSILEYDEVRLFSDLGHDVFSIGAYSDPGHPSDDKRPALPNVAYHPDLINLCKDQRVKHDGEDICYYIDWAKADLHRDLLDWADVTIFAAFPDAWIAPQWAKLKDRRVVWRTIGQSDPSTEQYISRACPGLEIVRYSPKEREAFESLGMFAGESAMIRFAKYPSDWYGWTGEERVVGNVTQDMAGRGEFCGYSFWMQSTSELPTRPAGPNSEALPGGIGTLDYTELQRYLRNVRAYLATGTQPASYTLNLIEAMMTGTPVIAMGRNQFGWPPIYEADEIAIWHADNPMQAAIDLERLLGDEDDALAISQLGRIKALSLFGVDVIAPQWQAYLSRVAVPA
jgi:glycosyltransferase involved in cell wall biosynthesis